MAKLVGMGGYVGWGCVAWVAKLVGMGSSVGGDGWLSWWGWVAKLVGMGG